MIDSGINHKKGGEMLKKLFLMSIVGILILSNIVYSEEKNSIYIKEFFSQKLLYDFDEKVKLNGVVVNETETSQKIKIEVWINKGVNQRFLIEKSLLDIHPKDTQQISCSFNLKDEYGYAAYLVLKTESGETITTSLPAVFEVCHDWRKICRMGAIGTTHYYFDPDSYKSSQGEMERVIKQFRSLYLNSIEFSGEWPPRVNDLTPKEEIWHYAYYEDPTAHESTKKAKISKTKLKEWINKFHENGIKVIGYTHTPDYPVVDESWRVYDASTGKYTHYDSDPVRIKWLDEKGIGAVNALKWKDDFSKKLAASIKEYGWDGYFLDSFNQFVEYTAHGVDKNGKPLVNISGDEIYAETLKTLNEQIKKMKDNFVIVPNGLHHILYGIELAPSRDMFGKNLEKFAYPKGNRFADVWFYEGQDITNRANTPWQLGRSLQAVRESTGKPVWGVFFIAPHPKCPGVTPELSRLYKIETVKPYMALLLSNGIGYWDHWGDIWLPSVEEDKVVEGIASYLKFACRYGQYLYDLDIHWTPKDMVEVEAPEHVYWKGNSFQKKFNEKYQEVYIHLINFDKSYLQAKLMDFDRKVPERVENIKVKINLPNNYKKIKSYALMADGSQEPLELNAIIKDGKVEIIVPSLEYWNLIIVQMER